MAMERIVRLGDNCFGMHARRVFSESAPLLASRERVANPSSHAPSFQKSTLYHHERPPLLLDTMYPYVCTRLTAVAHNQDTLPVL